MARDAPKQKIGASHVAGMSRQGLRELRNALYPESNISKDTDLGIFGNSTPGEISESRRSERSMDDPPQPELPGRDGIDLE